MTIVVTWPEKKSVGEPKVFTAEVNIKGHGIKFPGEGYGLFNKVRKK